MLLQSLGFLFPLPLEGGMWAKPDNDCKIYEIKMDEEEGGGQKVGKQWTCMPSKYVERRSCTQIIAIVRSLKEKKGRKSLRINQQ